MDQKSVCCSLVRTYLLPATIRRPRITNDHIGHRTAMAQEKRSLIELVKRHPLLTTVFGFWGFGYTFMVPNFLGGRFLQAFFHAVGSEPGKVFLGFGALFFMVFLFAGVVPFFLWYFVCQALESADTSSQTPKNG